MRMTMRSHYGAHAVIELARHYGEGPVQCAEIAARQQIPEAYLDQLLSTLRRVGFIRSQRGPHGGHELARDPRELTLGDVVTALEGPIVPHDLVTTLAPEDGADVDWRAACAVRAAWHAATEASQRVLDNTTIHELVEHQVLIRAHREHLPAEGISPTSTVLPTDDRPLERSL
jgi:Rrf2 family cysteine metabolism transcriptional repressor